MAHEKELTQIAYQFYENIYTLRIFNEQIGKLAEQYDRDTTQQFLVQLKSIFDLGEDFDISGSTPFRIDVAVKDPEPTDSELVSTKDQEEADNEERVKRYKAELENPEKLGELSQMFKLLRKSSPRQSQLLRQGAITTLSSYFEYLIADLIQYFYLKYPAAMPAESRVLSLTDLREIGSIEEAEHHLIMREIDALLRENTESQIDYFTKRPKIELKEIERHLDTLLEIFQRRNLYVHNNGIVNRLYLSRAPKEFLKQNSIAEGEKLHISGEYLSDAIDCICICGTILLQQCWRKWNKSDNEEADNVLREYIYDCLVDKRWKLTEQIAEFALAINLATENDRRIIIINLAIALKEQGKLDKMEKVLSSCDWSACALKFYVALYALRDQEDDLLLYLGKSVAAEEIDRDALEQWPLFRKFRESPKFIETLQGCFPEANEVHQLQPPVGVSE